MLHAILRDFQGLGAGVDHSLLHAFHLVAQHQGVGHAGGGSEVAQLQAALHLLQGQDTVARFAQFADRCQCVLVVGPGHRVLGTEGRLVDFGRGRAGRDAAQAQALQAQGVGGAKDAAHIVQAADVVQDDGEGEFVGGAVFLHRHATEFLDGKFSHGKWLFRLKK